MTDKATEENQPAPLSIASIHLEFNEWAFSSFCDLSRNGEIAGDSKNIFPEIVQASLISLMLAGRLSDVSGLLRVAGSIRHVFLAKDEEKFKTGKSKPLSPHLNKIKVLKEFFKNISDGFIPTSKRLRIATFGENFDEGRFSRLLRGMKIKMHLPKEPTHNMLKNGTQYRFANSGEFVLLPKVEETDNQKLEEELAAKLFFCKSF